MKGFSDFWWVAPEYFSRWRVFPRAFISMYIYLLYTVVHWFMSLPDPNMEQAGLVSIIVGSGAAWFGLYVNSTSTEYREGMFRAGSGMVEMTVKQQGSTANSPGMTTIETSSNDN